MSRGGRSEADANRHLAQHRKARERRHQVPRWSFTADRALKVAGVVVGLAIAWSYRAQLLGWWPL